MDWFSWLSRTSLEPALIYDYGLTFARNELQLEDASYFDHEFLQSMGISIAKHRLEILKLAKKEHHGAGAGAGAAARPKKLSGVIKKCLRKCMSKFVFREDVKDLSMSVALPPEPNWYQGKWRGTPVRKQGCEELKEQKDEKPMHRSRKIALSGPLDGSRMHEKMVSSKALKLSGPIDGKMNERIMMYTNRSPIISRPLDARFIGPARSPRMSGPLDTRTMFDNRRSPRLQRPSDARAESPMGGYSPCNKAEGDFDYDDDHALWPTLFQDLKPT